MKFQLLAKVDNSDILESIKKCGNCETVNDCFKSRIIEPGCDRPRCDGEAYCDEKIPTRG